MRNHISTMAMAASAMALLVAIQPTPVWAQAATPANQDDDQEEAAQIEDIIVTGSSIRGVAPIGSNLVAVDREVVERTAAVNATELTNTVPAITTSGSAPMGENSFSYYSPQIHSLAGSASNTTLVLVDGLRMPGGGTQFAQTDPNIIPTSAIQRVEVLADGASSVYGSDAVAGVVNYITRRSFDGFELNGRAGAADSFESYDLNGIWGREWDTGGFYVAGQWSDQGVLLNADRDFLNMGDYRPVGGRNVQSFACSPATIRTPSSGNNVYLSPSSLTTVPNSADFAPCNNSGYGAAIQSNERATVLVNVYEEVTDRLTLSAKVNYNHLKGSRPSGPGSITNVTAFGPGSGRGGQINPFYVAPAGDAAATQETVTWLALRENGDYGNQFAENDTFYLTSVLDYDLTDDWSLRLSYALGRSRSSLVTRDGFCSACANLALNGTSQSGGSLTATAVPGQNVIPLNIPLTTANALDVWHDLGSAGTSDEVMARLYSQDTSTEHYNNFSQTKLEVQGIVMTLPAGALRMAAGAEYMEVTQDVEGTNGTAIGATVDAASYVEYALGRSVYSAYAEFVVPLVSADMNVPFMQSFDVNVSGRYDNYEDVGSTTNPKVAANWQVNGDLRLRGNYATAFVAPPLNAIGIPELGYQRGPTGAGTSGAIIVPVSNYPDVVQLPGCTTATVTCQIGTSSSQGLSRSYGIGPDAKPQTGDSWSVGFDYSPSFIPGLTTVVTYWSNEFIGGVNRPEVSSQLNSASLRDRLTLCPTGCTQAQIDEFINLANGGSFNGVRPTTVYFLNNNDQGNLLNLRVQGIDANINYTFETDGFGVFNAGISATYYTKFDMDFGDAEWSVLNTSGANSTFPSIQRRARFSFGWEAGPITASAFVNYTGSYRNWNNSSVQPVLLDAAGNPEGGGDMVDAATTVDLNVAYDLDIAGLDRLSVYVDAKNVFDEDPSFYSGNTGGIGVGGYGYNGLVSNPIGRLVSVGFRLAL